MRLRFGSYRMFLRPMTKAELDGIGAEQADDGFWVARVVDKKAATQSLIRLLR